MAHSGVGPSYAVYSADLSNPIRLNHGRAYAENRIGSILSSLMGDWPASAHRAFLFSMMLKFHELVHLFELTNCTMAICYHNVRSSASPLKSMGFHDSWLVGCYKFAGQVSGLYPKTS